MNHDKLPEDVAPEDVNWPETLRITVESTAEAFDRAIEQAGSDGSADEAVRSFATPSRVFELLTDHRVAVLRSIMTEPPATSSDLADRLDRNSGAVHDDVDVLADQGIVQFREDTGTPFVPYEVIEVDVTIHGAPSRNGADENAEIESAADRLDGFGMFEDDEEFLEAVESEATDERDRLEARIAALEATVEQQNIRINTLEDRLTQY